ncbi:flagellar hook-length control protein FliK [Amphritea japonica]|uniref:Flagellar hook-length control protein-like C-terminal domain-containing protein n=1 Tax=Amphritea japonica ATCC BAA-1530 TaxID=1278309 RepID=A0A7R6PKJ7_9GAMM|nr:flagellar hook-length control protein FliK [Amphritea japonica]BBB25198.1 hypothetical protein AMJAP_0599 [Amphritea japonica ATCC BAA-1530]
MLNPLSVQSLQTNTGKSLSAAELVRALPLNNPTQITVRQSSADTTRPNQFTLQVQLGSQLYQLKSNQSLPPGSAATLTRTAAGQILLSTIATAPSSQLQTLTQPATTQTKPIQSSSAGTQPGANQRLAAEQSPIVQIKGSTEQKQGQPQTTDQPRLPPATANLPSRLSAELNKLLPLNRPVLATINVTAQAGNQGGANSIIATINGRTLPLTLNQQLPFDGKVLLVRTNNEQVLVQSITSPTQNQSLDRHISEALRYVLPAQQPVADALVKLQQLNTNIGADKSPINSILSSLINLFGVKTAPGETQTGIQQNLLNGGLFTERNLASPHNQIPSGEMKKQLSQLLQQADKLPEQPRQQLHELVKGLLSRVTSNQLESIQNTRVSSDGGLERFFALDLPVRNGEQLDNVELKISEHRNQLSESEWQQLWRVRLHFDLQEQGSVDAELILEEEHQITAHFWCSSSQTAGELSEKLPDFNRQLHRQGYSITGIHCSEGVAPKALNRVEQLIDVTT